MAPRLIADSMPVIGLNVLVVGAVVTGTVSGAVGVDGVVAPVGTVGVVGVWLPAAASGSVAPATAPVGVCVEPTAAVDFALSAASGFWTVVDRVPRE